MHTRPSGVFHELIVDFTRPKFCLLTYPAIFSAIITDYFLIQLTYTEIYLKLTSFSSENCLVVVVVVHASHQYFFCQRPLWLYFYAFRPYTELFGIF